MGELLIYGLSSKLHAACCIQLVIRLSTTNDRNSVTLQTNSFNHHQNENEPRLQAKKTVL